MKPEHPTLGALASRRHFPYFAYLTYLTYLTFFVPSVAFAADYSDAIQAVAKAAQAEIDAKNITGVSVALVEGQRIIHINGFGLADKKQKILSARDTVYRAGSISKLFTDIA